MKSELKKKYYVDPGSYGRPSHYPVPPENEDLLFYIQRNQNLDTIVYELNHSSGKVVNRDLPMHAYWIKYSEGGVNQELNHLQNKLAFGYESREISPDLYVFNFVSYKELTLYIARQENGRFKVICDIDHQQAILDHIYVYAVEFGVFPDVKFIELFGEGIHDGSPLYEKIIIN